MPSFPRLLGLIVLLSACQAGSNVSVDYDTATVFSQYRNYHWAARQQPLDPLTDPLIVARIHQALETQLLLTGLQPVTASEQTDLLVGYRLINREAGFSNQPSTSISIGGGSGSYGSHGGAGIAMNFPLGASKAIGESEIIIDLIDARSNRLKWRGSKAITLTGKSPDQISRTVEAAVAEILGFYPPH